MSVQEAVSTEERDDIQTQGTSGMYGCKVVVFFPLPDTR